MNQGQAQIQAFDWRRIFIGQAPASFLLETVLRAVMVYIVLLISMRLLGKRTASQLTLTELAVVVTLGAAVGVPLQVPERGMLPGVVVLAVAILFQRGLNLLGFRSGRAARTLEGDVSILIRDGQLDLPAMKLAGVGRQQLFAVLRTKGVEQLGQVRRLYLEATGEFSVIRRDEPDPGLSIVPESDTSLRDLGEIARGRWACRSCGHLIRGASKPSVGCERCAQQRWTEAMWERSRGGSNSQQQHPERQQA
jgi:uncharacterized membrane protein YcaP (DUF421 family)